MKTKKTPKIIHLLCMVRCEKWILHDLDVDHLSKISSKDEKKFLKRNMLNLCTKKIKMRKLYNGEFETPNFLQVRKKKKKRRNGEIGAPHFSIPLRK
jgi:hypothetical protein